MLPRHRDRRPAEALTQVVLAPWVCGASRIHPLPAGFLFRFASRVRVELLPDLYRFAIHGLLIFCQRASFSGPRLRVPCIITLIAPHLKGSYPDAVAAVNFYIHAMSYDAQQLLEQGMSLLGIYCTI